MVLYGSVWQIRRVFVIKNAVVYKVILPFPRVLSTVILIAVLTVASGACVCSALESTDTSRYLILPASTDTPSDRLAMQLLAVSAGLSSLDTRILTEVTGFSVDSQYHYEKAADDMSYTCAYTIASGEVSCDDVSRQALLIVLRAAALGEWYSFFDVFPSGNDDSEFAENYLFCAEDVFLTLQSVLDTLPPDTAVIVTGLNRGGACANLLGILLNEYQPDRDIYVYTFASPATIRQDSAFREQDNIFNYRTSSDLFSLLPLEQWGYVRAGTDIDFPEGILNNDVFNHSAEEFTESFLAIAPTAADYYQTRHSLTGPGEDPLGLTPFEFLLYMCNILEEQTKNLLSTSDTQSFSEQLQSIRSYIEEGQSMEEQLQNILSFLPEGFQESDYYPLFQSLIQLLETDLDYSLEQISSYLPPEYAPYITQLQEAIDGLY